VVHDVALVDPRPRGLVGDEPDPLLAGEVLAVCQDDLRRRVDEAAQIVPLERLALSPQCGFASVAAGNALDEDDQWRKLELVVDTARQIWS